MKTVPGLPAAADTLTGRVVGVHDGDTLTLLLMVSWSR